MKSRLRLAFKKQMFQNQFQNSTLVPGITQMKDEGYKIRDQYAIHYITFAVVEWIDVFQEKLIQILYYQA